MLAGENSHIGEEEVESNEGGNADPNDMLHTYEGEC